MAQSLTNSNSIKKPFLVNKGTIGRLRLNPRYPGKEETRKGDAKKQKNKQPKGNKISYLRIKNLKFADEIEAYTRGQNLDDETIYHVQRLLKNLRSCSSVSIYSLFGDEIQYHGSHTCDNKNCNICNFNRQKAIRRKYLEFFKANPVFLEYHGKLYTRRKLDKQLENEHRVGVSVNTKEVPYDLMHLTLTVPHYKEVCFQNNKYYFKEIIQRFHMLRRQKFWKQYVYGGEYGVETTVTDNGLNIHIHSLLFVKRSEQNRNRLHKELLKSWNQLTVNESSTRTEISQEARQYIKKSNRLLTDQDINSLNPKGATMVGLETIFTQDRKKAKVRSMDETAFISAVLETISYHFEPHAFDKESGEVNVELLIDLLPYVYGQRLYGKFGILFGDDSLNIKTNDNFPDLDIPEEDIDKETGEIKERRYFIIDPFYVKYIPEKNYKAIIPHYARDKLMWLKALTLREAIEETIYLLFNIKT
jgi:hypothetical protein